MDIISLYVLHTRKCSGLVSHMTEEKYVQTMERLKITDPEIQNWLRDFLNGTLLNNIWKVLDRIFGFVKNVKVEKKNRFITNRVSLVLLFVSSGKLPFLTVLYKVMGTIRICLQVSHLFCASCLFLLSYHLYLCISEI